MGLSLWGEEILTEKAASFTICLVYRWNFPHRSRTKYFATLKFDYRIIWIVDDYEICSSEIKWTWKNISWNNFTFMPNVIHTNTWNKRVVICFQDTQIKTAYLDYHYPRLNDNNLVFTCLVLPICLK